MQLWFPAVCKIWLHGLRFNLRATIMLLQPDPRSQTNSCCISNMVVFPLCAGTAAAAHNCWADRTRLRMLKQHMCRSCSTLETTPETNKSDSR